MEAKFSNSRKEIEVSMRSVMEHIEQLLRKFSTPGDLRLESMFYGEDGEDLDSWIGKADQWFTSHFWMSEMERVESATTCLDGEAWAWFQRIDRRQSIKTWGELKKLMLAQFCTNKASIDEEIPALKLVVEELCQLEPSPEKEEEKTEQVVEEIEVSLLGLKQEITARDSHCRYEESAMLGNMKLGENLEGQQAVHTFKQGLHVDVALCKLQVSRSSPEVKENYERQIAKLPSQWKEGIGDGQEHTGNAIDDLRIGAEVGFNQIKQMALSIFGPNRIKSDVYSPNIISHPSGTVLDESPIGKLTHQHLTQSVPLKIAPQIPSILYVLYSSPKVSSGVPKTLSQQKSTPTIAPVVLSQIPHSPKKFSPLQIIQNCNKIAHQKVVEWVEQFDCQTIQIFIPVGVVQNFELLKICATGYGVFLHHILVVYLNKLNHFVRWKLKFRSSITIVILQKKLFNFIVFYTL